MTQEKKSFLDLKMSPVLLTVIVALLMWQISRRTPGISIPVEIRTACLLLLCGIGLYVGLAGVSAFRKARTTVNPFRPENCSRLVTTGILERTRNPMYLALLLSLTGWGIYLSNIFSLLLIVLYFLYLDRYQIQPEERALEAMFGEEFKNYAKRVRRWL